MPLSDPRPYPRLTAAQKDHTLREVALCLALMDWVPSGKEREYADQRAHEPRGRDHCS